METEKVKSRYNVNRKGMKYKIQPKRDIKVKVKIDSSKNSDYLRRKLIYYIVALADNKKLDLKVFNLNKHEFETCETCHNHATPHLSFTSKPVLFDCPLEFKRCDCCLTLSSIMK